MIKIYAPSNIDENLLWQIQFKEYVFDIIVNLNDKDVLIDVITATRISQMLDNNFDTAVVRYYIVQNPTIIIEQAMKWDDIVIFIEEMYHRGELEFLSNTR